MSFSPRLLSQPTPSSACLHPSPGFSVTHTSFSVALSSFPLEMLRVAGLEVTTQRATAGTPSLPQSLKVLWPGEGGQQGWQR